MSFTRHRYSFSWLLFLIPVAFAIGISGCAKDPAPVKNQFVRLLDKESIYSDILKLSVTYSILLPENYDSSADDYPVVYLLHGFGDNKDAWYNYGLIKYYSDLDEAENGSMIFVMPQGFNSYYVNRYNNSFRYMDFFASELVPEIDSLYRTRKDKTQRAVMGYSMGGYGALILPAMHPEIFSVSVPLSMSFRTDDQYKAESDGSFNYQWGPIFGGSGTQGLSRLTNYFKERSPFYFFKEWDLTRFEDLNIFIDCGDDEESLLVTNNALHCLMRDYEIPHEFRIRNGGHSWETWHASLHEALSFISYCFRGADYPENSEGPDTGPAVPAEFTSVLEIDGGTYDAGVLLPPGYDAINGTYPVIYLVHDFKTDNRQKKRAELFSLFYNSMLASKFTKSLVIEIPAESFTATENEMQAIINQVDLTYKTRKDQGRMLMGNGEGGGLAVAIALADTGTFSSFCIYGAVLPDDIPAGRDDIFYYMDSCDESESYQGYNNLYNDLKSRDMQFEYRCRQGKDSWESFLTGLSDSFSVLKKHLVTTA